MYLRQGGDGVRRESQPGPGQLLALSLQSPRPALPLALRLQSGPHHQQADTVQSSYQFFSSQIRAFLISYLSLCLHCTRAPITVPFRGLSVGRL